MVERDDINGEGARAQGAAMSAADVDAWFVREVLPLETILMQFLRRNWSNPSDIADMRQDVYVRVYEAARKQIPHPTTPFVLTIARNLIINRVRRERIVPIEAVADLDALGVAIDQPGPDRVVMARESLRRVQAALDRLPPRARDVIVLKQIEGLSRREIAERMGIGDETVKWHLARAMRTLADVLYGEPADLRRKP
jgi:RNA polymerase sigma factor (sigma-70 family)